MLRRHYIMYGVVLILSNTECSKPPPDAMTKYEEFLIAARDTLIEFNGAIDKLSAEAADVCGSPDSSFFTGSLVIISDVLCAALKSLVLVQAAFRCQTWLPLYYNAVYNAMCYNGTNGVWALAATLFAVVFMTCIIMTFRAVFWDLEISDDVSNVDNDGKDGYKSEQGFEVVTPPGGAVEEYGTGEPSTYVGTSQVGVANAQIY